LGLVTCKNRRPYNLYCVGGDVKPCSINPQRAGSPSLNGGGVAAAVPLRAEVTRNSYPVAIVAVVIAQPTRAVVSSHCDYG